MPKLLGDFLQEQQEPFLLKTYLLERGYYSTSRNSARFSKRRLLNVPGCPKLVKAVCSRLVGLHNNQKINKIFRRKNTPAAENGEECGDEASLSCTTVSSCCSGREADSNLFSDEEADADRELKWRSVEDSNNKQLSPVSVLEQTESDQDQFESETAQGESSTSTAQCKSKQPTDELLSSSSNYAQYIINKRELHQSKRLLIDCVREVIEKNRKREDKSGQQLKKILGTDELWKFVCENVWLWSQNPIHEANILHLLNCDMVAFYEEERCADFEQQKEEVSMEIGDAILEGIINEIVIG